MSDTTYKLLCIIEGEKFPFFINVSSTIYIADLKILIKKEKPNVCQMVDASGLIIWKVNVDFDAVEDKVLRGEFQPHAHDQSQPLQSVKADISQLFEVWPEPPPHGHLHVFITQPEQGTPFNPINLLGSSQLHSLSSPLYQRRLFLEMKRRKKRRKLQQSIMLKHIPSKTLPRHHH